MKSHAEAKRESRAKKRSEGYVLKQIWVKPGNWVKIKKYLERWK